MRLLERLGLHRQELRAWAMYDWANSTFQTTVITAVFPRFFADYAAAGLPATAATQRFAWASTIAAVIVAVLGPVLGAIADYRAAKKRLLAISLAVGVIATAMMALIGRGDWKYAAAVFIVGNIAMAASLVFYDSLLPHLASPEELDRVSTAGYAMGYVGGGLLLIVNLVWILSPQTFGLPDAAAATKLSFLSVAAWWLLFSIPLFRRVPEPPAIRGQAPAGNILTIGFRLAWRTLRELRSYPNALLMLVAFLLYNDGIQTMIRMSSIYGAAAGIDANAQIAAFVMVQFVGIPCSYLFGSLGTRIGTKRAIFIAISVYVIAAGLAFFMTSVIHFFLLAFLVALVLGGSQALSRALFSRLIPHDRTSEFFGFYAVSERFATVFGPALFTLSVLITGNSRAAILAIILLFVAGAAVLSRVDEVEGMRAAANG